MTAYTLIQTAERELLESSTRGRAERVRELQHPDFVEVGRSGRRWTRGEVIDAMGREDRRPAPDTDEWDFTQLGPHPCSRDLPDPLRHPPEPPCLGVGHIGSRTAPAVSPGNGHTA